MSKIELDLKEAVVINGNEHFSRPSKLETMDKINFDIQNGKLLGWEIDGRKLAVSAKPNEVVEPHFCNMSEVLDTVNDVATYYDNVSKHVKRVAEANADLSKNINEGEDKDILKHDVYLDSLIDRAGVTHLSYYNGRYEGFNNEPPVDPVLSVRSVIKSPVGSNSMSGLVHYFVPVNEAAKEVQGKPCSEGLLTKEQLKSLLGK